MRGGSRRSFGRTAFATALGLFAVACGGPNLTTLAWRASHDLSCGKDALELVPLDEDGASWGVNGCDRRATYSWTETSGRGEWVMTSKPRGSEAAPSE